MIKRMESHIAAYVAGLMDGLAGQTAVQFRWDESYSTVVLRGPPDVLKWFEQATGVAHDPDPMGAYWTVNGPDLLELLTMIRPFAVKKAGDYDQMIAWLKRQSDKAPTAGIMPC